MVCACDKGGIFTMLRLDFTKSRMFDPSTQNPAFSILLPANIVEGRYWRQGYRVVVLPDCERPMESTSGTMRGISDLGSVRVV
jgi:hypothetical protein